MGVSGEMLRNLHQGSPGEGWLRTPDHERDLSEAIDSTEDPESPREIVHENVLVIFPLALAFLFLLFGLVIAFSK